MPKRSAVATLPKAVKDWLDAALVEGNFSGYEQLSAELKARGCDVSKSALHRYGQDFESRLAALKICTEQARAVVAASPDEDNAVNEALLRLVQKELFEIMATLSPEQRSAKDLAKIAKGIADLGRASVQQKKYAAEVAKRAQETAETVARVAKKGGLSSDTVDRIKREILNIPA